MTEFFFPNRPRTGALTGNGRVSYVHRTCRRPTQSNRRRTFKQNPRGTHSVDGVTNLGHLLKCSLYDSRTGVNESSQDDKLVTERGYIKEEQIAKVRILNEK